MPATDRYIHPDGKGVGEHHLGRELPADMRDLDMASGTEVERAGTDEDTAAPVVAWTDSTGTARRTTIDPGFFAAYFDRLTPEGTT